MCRQHYFSGEPFLYKGFEALVVGSVYRKEPWVVMLKVGNEVISASRNEQGEVQWTSEPPSKVAMARLRLCV